VLAALGARVTLPARDAKYDTARIRIANAAILPSRVFRDTGSWTTITPRRRTLAVRGWFDGGRYHLVADSNAPVPAVPAESQHLIHLTRLSDDSEYAWDTDVLFGLGALTASETGAFFRTLLSGAEARTEREVRDDYRSAVPGGTRLLGQLFRVDSVRPLHLPDGSTHVTYGITMTPGGLEDRYPNFARYMRRYAETARIRLSLADESGAVYMTFTMRDGHMVFRARTRQGQVVPLTGPLRVMPDTLVLSGDFTLQVRFFTVGFHDYSGELVLTRQPHDVGFTLVSREEPSWVLPLVTERLLRSPLRRPFQGPGALFAMSVRDSAEAQTILLRRLHIEVKESAILRFISRLSSAAYGDFQGRVEREQLAWLKEVFDALVADARRLAR
jgi:hypothetical protein